MPQNPKPTAGRPARDRTKETDEATVKAARSTAAWPPPPPPNLAPEVLAWWHAFWNSPLAARHARADLDSGIHRLAELKMRRIRAEKQLKRSLFATGSTGQLVAHPANGLIARIDSDILALEDRFGLNPKSRIHLGVSVATFLPPNEDPADDAKPELKLVQNYAEDGLAGSDGTGG